MVNYAHRIIVTGMNSLSCISTLLYASDLGRQTSVLYFHLKGDQLLKGHYVWEHPRLRPNTHTFPVACPECNHIRSWSRGKRSGGKSFTLRCKAKVEKDGVRVRCSGSHKIACRPATIPISSPYNGCWLAHDA